MQSKLSTFSVGFFPATLNYEYVVHIRGSKASSLITVTPQEMSEAAL